MKKIYYLFVTAILFAVAGGAQARYWKATGEDGFVAPVVSDFKANTPYVLSKGNSGNFGAVNYLSHENSFLSGESTATDDHLWYFEAVDAEKGDYRIYWLDGETKKYVSNQTAIGNYFTSNVNSRIGVFRLTTVEFCSADDYSAYLEEGGEPYPTTQYDGYSEDEHVVFLDVTYEYSEVVTEYDSYMFFRYGNSATVGSNTAANVWYVLEMEEMQPEEAIEALLTDMGLTDFDIDNYNVGEDPGQYNGEVLEALAEAIQNAIDNPCDETFEALKKAYAYFEEHGFVQFGEGYYVFESFRTLDAEKHGVIFDNMNDAARTQANNIPYNDRYRNHIAVTNSSGTTVGEDFDVFNPEDDTWMESEAAPYFIWQVTKAGLDKEGRQLFYFQNYKTKRYIGTVDGYNKAVSATDTPVNGYNMMPNPSIEGAWVLYSPDLPTKNGWAYGGLHCPGDWNGLVDWDYLAEASSWKPYYITPEQLAYIDAVGEQPRLNSELKTLVTQAEEAIAGSKTFGTFDTKTGEVATPHIISSIEPDGLVTSEEQITTNSVRPDDGAGIAGLVDGDFGTFYHSTWNNDYAPEKVEVVDPEDPENMIEIYPPQYLAFDLQNSYKDVTIKWYSRKATDGNEHLGLPTKVRVSASADGENWVVVSEESEFQYEALDNAHRVTVGEGEEAEVQDRVYTGFLPVKMEKAYQHVRFELLENHRGVKYTENTENYPSQLYMNASEVRVYEGIIYEYKYNAAESTYEGVPADVREALDKAIAAAKEEVESGAATQATINALSAALEAFNNKLPNPSNVQNKVDEAKAQAEAVINDNMVGEGIGYFEAGAAEALLAVANSIQVGNNSTVDEINAALEKIEAAVAEFNKHLHTPVAGTYYYIKSETHGGANWIAGKEEAGTITDDDYENAVTYYADEDYLGTRNLNPFNVGWGNEANAKNIDEYAGYIWQAVGNADGTISFRHALTNLYMGCEPVNNANVTLVAADSEQKANFSFQTAKVAGVLNIVAAPQVFLNAQPGTNNVVTWNAASGNDNSAFSFEEVEDAVGTTAEEMTIDLNGDRLGYGIVTLPYTVTPDLTAYDAYTVEGLSGTEGKYYLELTKVSGEVEAGTPFIVWFGSNAEQATTGLPFQNVKFGAETQGKLVNGVQGVLVNTAIPGEGYLTFKHNKITGTTSTVLAAEGAIISAGSGFMSAELPAVEHKDGNVQIFCADGKATGDIIGIEQILNNAVKAQGTFDLQGRRVQNAVKGLYIINGQKYIVK